MYYQKIYSNIIYFNKYIKINYTQPIYNKISNYYYILKSTYFLYYCIKNDIHENKIIENLVDSIDNSGCLYIKFIQWILPRFDQLNVNDKLNKTLEKYYEKCNVHDLEYTLYKFKEDFKYDLYDKYEIIDIIGSGSVGQVYKIKEKSTENYLCLKILHPNIEKEYQICKNIFNFIYFFIDIKKYIPIYDFENFFNGLKDQLNLNKEVNNILEFKNIYKDDKLYLIPNIINFTENIIIMTYIESENKDKLTNVKKIHVFMKLLLFIFNSSYYGICHGDLHIGNWGISNNKLIIYDFGYCLRFDRHNYVQIEGLLLNNNRIESFGNIIKYGCKLINKDPEFYQNLFFESYHNNYGKENISMEESNSHLYKFLIENEIYISSELFNTTLVSGNLEYLSDPSTINAKDTDNCYFIIEELIDLCDAYDTFSEYKKHLCKNYQRKLDSTILNLKKYENLKHLI